VKGSKEICERASKIKISKYQCYEEAGDTHDPSNVLAFFLPSFVDLPSQNKIKE
jgi:hypothetical protein